MQVLKLKNNLVLYHGSYARIEKINFAKCVQGKDFGSGFYVTTDYAQSAKFVRTSIEKAVRNELIPEGTEKGFVNSFLYTEKSDVKIYEFKKANCAWLHFVAGNRRLGIFEEEIAELGRYDIVVGKIANDDTNRVINTCINEIYDVPGSCTADRTAIQLLLPNRLSNQICFRNEKAVSCLLFKKAEEVSI